MSAQHPSVRLMWYVVHVTTKKDGKLVTYECQFLCSSVEGAEARGRGFSMREGEELITVRVDPTPREAYDGRAAANMPLHSRGGTVPALPAPAATEWKKERKATREKAYEAMVLSPVKVETRLYVQPKEAGL